MSKLSTLEGLDLVEGAISDLKKEDRLGTRHFAVNPEEETLLQIEVRNGDPEQMYIGGFLYRVVFDDQGDHSITLVV